MELNIKAKELVTLCKEFINSINKPVGQSKKENYKLGKLFIKVGFIENEKNNFIYFTYTNEK